MNFKYKISKSWHKAKGKGTYKFRELRAIRKIRTSTKDEDYVINPIPPYISQLADADTKQIEGVGQFRKIHDVKAAKRFGTSSLREFSFWAWRSCGIVCIQSLLKAYDPHFNKTTMYLIREALKLDGYNIKTDVGWYHKSLVALAHEHSLSAHAREYVSPNEIPLYLMKNHYVISSMESPTGVTYCYCMDLK